jgi:3-carboxy-cis,cis-muconate cycloisomerase
MDTATVLQLRPVLDVIVARLDTIIARLAEIAEAEAETIMAARTRTQIALPATFGALVAHWGTPLLTVRVRFAALRPRLMRLSLHGAVGTDAALGHAAPEVRHHMAAALGLSASDTPWHTDRHAMAELGSALTLLTAALGRIGKDIADLAQSGIAEVRVTGGASSTMPHKSNPVAAEALVTLARHTAHLQGSVYESAIHGQFRDGMAWALEWMSLRQIAVATGAGLRNARLLIESLKPDRDRMRSNLDAAGFGPYAEAASFTLARQMPRGEAKAAVSAALATDDPATDLAHRLPGVDWTAVCDPLTAAGTSPQQARDFTRAARGGT